MRAAKKIFMIFVPNMVHQMTGFSVKFSFFLIPEGVCPLRHPIKAGSINVVMILHKHAKAAGDRLICAPYIFHDILPNIAHQMAPLRVKFPKFFKDKSPKWFHFRVKFKTFFNI